MRSSGVKFEHTSQGEIGVGHSKTPTRLSREPADAEIDFNRLSRARGCPARSWRECWVFEVMVEVLNIFTNHAFHKREISVFGGEQLRPNINIIDMVNSYIELINAKNELINGEIFNVGDVNLSVKELAFLVKSVVGDDVNLKFIESDDNRSYHISSKKITEKLGFNLKSSLKEAISSLYDALENKLLDDPLNNPKYYNIKTMQKINLK